MVDDKYPVPLDELFELLADRRRRYVLYEMAGEGHRELPDLAESIAEREIDIESDDILEARMDVIKRQLHHTHLPKLHEANLLEYDDRQNDVYADEYLDLAGDFLEIAREYEMD